jgi:hypothetical protein
MIDLKITSMFTQYDSFKHAFNIHFKIIAIYIVEVLFEFKTG